VKRYTLSSSFLGVVLSAKVAFSERSWPYLAACAVPWLLCAGQRCVRRLAENLGTQYNGGEISPRRAQVVCLRVGGILIPRRKRACAACRPPT
jgi:hypothetical protein